MNFTTEARRHGAGEVFADEIANEVFGTVAVLFLATGAWTLLILSKRPMASRRRLLPVIGLGMGLVGFLMFVADADVGLRRLLSKHLGTESLCASESPW